MDDAGLTASVWEGAEVVSVYTRAQAIEDGVLVDLSGWAEEAGFKIPVAVTAGVWGVLKPSAELEAEGEDEAGRAWDLFTVLQDAIRRAPGGDEAHVAPLFTLKPGEPPEPVEMWAKCGPGDDAAPVITVMLRGED
ncbi:MAG: hypothetical protein KGL53_07200 [Elusimicrobia bacterium]|nr:hypothetical protein [Elusimicrobiota bacterium]